MTEVNAINRKGPIDSLYEAEFDGTCQIWAASLAQATQRAVEHFRLKRKHLPFLKLTLVKP